MDQILEKLAELEEVLKKEEYKSKCDLFEPLDIVSDIRYIVDSDLKQSTVEMIQTFFTIVSKRRKVYNPKEVISYVGLEKEEIEELVNEYEEAEIENKTTY